MDCLGCLRGWRQWVGFAIVIAYVCVLVIALPLCILELEKKNAANHVEAWFIGGIFVMMALPISFWGILNHVLNYTVPDLQRYIIRILWMVPIYAINAWFALRFPAAAIYLDTLRECYEAYVIYNFMSFLMSFLNKEYPHLELQVENKPPVKQLFPLCCFPPCQNGRSFVQRCKHGVLQYTVVRPAMTVIAVMCNMFGKYGEGDFNFASAWSYIVLINNLSQILAMYCLVLFYKAFKEELKPLKPLSKFMCVKAVVFLSFWQGLAIAVLVKLNVIPHNGTWVFYKDIQEVATGIQDFLICIEMFLAAIAHYYSFSHKPYINLAAEQENCCTSFLSMWNVSDVTDDVVEHARFIGRGVHKRLNRDWRGRCERTPLLADSSRSAMIQRENMQSRTTPSPAVILENEVARPFDFDYNSSTEHSFVNKSTTLSMNNYAEFSVSESDDEARRAIIVSGSTVQSSGERRSDEIKNASVSSEVSYEKESITVRDDSVGKTSSNNDDAFEEIDAEEANINEEKEDDVQNLSVPQVEIDTQHLHVSRDNQDEEAASNDATENIVPDNQSQNTFADDHNPIV